MDRQIVLDTETTGLEVALGHRIIEIGCLELRNRRATSQVFHHYLNPDRSIDFGAVQVHGITNEFLADKPRFREIAPAFIEFVRDAELIIHNADFDVGFLNAELAQAGLALRLEDICRITDTVQMARRLHPGQKNSLDALCKRYSVDNSQRDMHGALLDARLLADVYLAMTTGQSALQLAPASADGDADQVPILVDAGDAPLPVIRASAEELQAHWARLEVIAKKAGKLVWQDELPAAAQS